jgi:hypothetical protein
MLMRQIVVCGLPGSTVFFSHYLTNGKIFEKRFIEPNIFVSVVSTNLSGTFLLFREIERDMINMFIVLHRRTRFYCQILMKLEFSRQSF